MEVALKAWYNGARAYTVGVKLYKLFGKDELLKKELMLGETTVRKNRLVAAIAAMLPPSDQNVKPEPVNILYKLNKVQNVQVSDTTKVEAKEVADLKKKAIPLFKERDQLHAKLLLFDSDAERGKAAHRILELDDAIDNIYDDIRYYEQHKQLPEKLPFDVITDPTKWLHRYETLGRYVTRYAAKGEKGKAKKEQYEAEQLYYAKKLGKWD